MAPAGPERVQDSGHFKCFSLPLSRALFFFVLDMDFFFFKC